MAITEHQGDTGHLFRMVNKLLRKAADSSLPQCGTPADLARTFSDFFINKITKILNFQPASVSPEITPVSCNFCTFRPVHEREVTKIITSLANKSCDMDPLLTALLKKTVHQLSPVITAIINKSMFTGVFLEKYKTALVTPLLKKANLDVNNFNDYHPVSNLAFI